MHTKKKLSVLLALVLCLVMLVSCAGNNNPPGTSASSNTTSSTNTSTNPDPGTPNDGIKRGGTVVISLGDEPTNLNPDGNYDSANAILVQNCFNRLIKLNSMQEVLPDLAESYEITDDGLSYTFHLYKDIYCHDGQKLTSDDVKFTFEYIEKHETFASYIMAHVDSVTCPDADTVVFNMSSVDASFLYNLAYQGSYILPRHVYEGKDWGGGDSLQSPVGTGPFVYDNWDKGTRLTLKRNDNYFMGPDLPYLDGIILAFVADGTVAKTAFMAGEYDILGNLTAADYSEFRTDDSISMEINIYPSRFIVAFNQTENPLTTSTCAWPLPTPSTTRKC